MRPYCGRSEVVDGCASMQRLAWSENSGDVLISSRVLLRSRLPVAFIPTASSMLFNSSSSLALGSAFWEPFEGCPACIAEFTGRLFVGETGETPFSDLALDWLFTGSSVRHSSEYGSIMGICSLYSMVIVNRNMKRVWNSIDVLFECHCCLARDVCCLPVCRNRTPCERTSNLADVSKACDVCSRHNEPHSELCTALKGGIKAISILLSGDCANAMCSNSLQDS